MPLDALLSPGHLFFALLGGILPATFWLWFWLKEDKLHPEPRGLLITSFAVGMLAAMFAIPFENLIGEFFVAGSFTLLFLWSFVEEVLKFCGIYFVALRSKYFDEPIDGVIYLITTALGFAALENALFLFSPIVLGDTLGTLTLSSFRFIGSSLLHVGASGLVGVALALTFYQKWIWRATSAIFAVFAAVLLHTLFNFSIIVSEGRYMFVIFAVLWVVIIGILFICEKINRMVPRSHLDYPHTRSTLTKIYLKNHFS